MSIISEIVVKLKEKKAEYIIGGLTFLASLLFVIIWQGWLSSKLAQAGASIPKQVLGALLGEVAILLVAAVIYILHIRKALKQSQAALTELEKQTQEKIDELQKQIPLLKQRNGELASQLEEATLDNRTLKKRVQELSHEVLDETSIKILTHLARTNADKYAQSIADNLELNFERAKYYLEMLVENDYVSKARPRITMPIKYLLTQKARDFLYKNNLI